MAALGEFLMKRPVDISPIELEGDAVVAGVAGNELLEAD